MLLKAGRAVYFLVIVLIVLVFTSVQDKPRTVIRDGWKMTQQTFGHKYSSGEQDINITSMEPIAIQSENAESASPYAYVFYATQDTYACSVLVNIHQLLTIHKTPHRIFVLASYQISPIYLEAFERLNVNVTLQTPPPIPSDSPAASYYADCLLKLYAFQMHRIDASLKRVVVLDADVLILKPLDSMFEEVGEGMEVAAAAKAYWIGEKAVTTAFMVVELGEELWGRMEQAMRNMGYDRYDMDLVNEVLGDGIKRLENGLLALNSHWEDWSLPVWFGKNGDGEVGKEDLTRGEEGRNRDKLQSRQDEAQTPSTDKDSGFSEWNPVDNTSPPLSDDSLDSMASIKFSDPSIPEPPRESSSSLTSDTNLTSISDRKNYKQLYELYDNISVLHFTALGKPWEVKNATIERERPNAHPLFNEQFLMWHEVAREVCPTVVWEGIS